MSLLEPIKLPPVYTPEDFANDAATAPTTFGSYLGTKFGIGGDQSSTGRALDLLSDASAPADRYTAAQQLATQYAAAGMDLPPGLLDVAPPAASDQRRLSEDEWRKLKFDRPGLEFQANKTVEEAQARTSDFDMRRYNESIIQRYQGPMAAYVAGFGAQMLGGAPALENFIPFVGEGVRAAMVARLGVIGGHVAASAADAAIGNLAIDALTFPDLNRRGEDLGAEDLALDLSLGAVTGGLFGFGGGLLARRSTVANAVRLDGLPRQADAMEVAVGAVARDEPVDVGTIVGDLADVRSRIPAETVSLPFGDLPQARVYGSVAVPERIDIPGTPAHEVQTPDGPVIRAYHGSPHTFDQFSMEHIGAGEGAQAYGHGLYFADSSGVAKSYQEKLTNDNSTRIAIGDRVEHPGNLADELWSSAKNERLPSDPENYSLDESTAAARGWNAAFYDLADGKLTPASELDSMDDYDAGYLAARKVLAERKAERHAGALYTVDIHADPEHMLDWDKPLSEQSPKVRSLIDQNMPLLERQWADVRAGDEDIPTLGLMHEMTGADLYQILGRGESKAKASDILRDAGIPGIKYLDGQSRTAGEGSRNYVLFDDSRIKIREINGKAVERSIDPPASLAEAEKRVGRDTTNKQLAEDLGVGDPDKLVTRLQQEGTAKAKIIATPASTPKFPEGMQIEKQKGGAYQVRDSEGKSVARVTLASGGEKPFVDIANVEPEFRRQGIASKVYDFIENDIGRKLVPSPLGLSDEATGFWKKRLAGMSPDERAAILDESMRLGLAYGIKAEHIEPRLAPFRSLPVDAKVKPVAPKRPVDDIPEMQDIDALRSSGRLTEADESELVKADNLVKRADAYGDAYNILVGCVLRNGE